MMLYNRVRPTELGDVVGNRSTVATIKRWVEPADVPHAILLAGPSGSGKTTLARIIASFLQCASMDFSEINASESRGIDTTRAIIAAAVLAPSGGDRKIFLLDEAHQLTGAAQNSLLKAIEDCPRSTYFILCTTEPDKIIPTVRNRCCQLATTLLRPLEITSLLTRALTVEEVDTEWDGWPILFKDIATRSGGSARASLVMLEKIVAVETVEEAQEILNQDDVHYQADIVKSLIAALTAFKRSVDSRWELVRLALVDNQDEPERVRIALVNYLHAMVLSGTNFSRADMLVAIIECLLGPLYTSGDAKAGLTIKLYNACCIEMEAT